MAFWIRDCGFWIDLKSSPVHRCWRCRLPIENRRSRIHKSMSLSSANFRSRPALLWFLLPAVVGLEVELYTKQVAVAKLAPWDVERRDNGRVVVNIPPGEEQPV